MVVVKVLNDDARLQPCPVGGIVLEALVIEFHLLIRKYLAVRRILRELVGKEAIDLAAVGTEECRADKLVFDAVALTIDFLRNVGEVHREEWGLMVHALM